ncbi:hypothetical protein A5715_12355 [Mycolicibacter heraklionensis]|nr:hypothetical protein A5715_12355 [Mycolicibacter heraklionensis]
MPWAAFPSWRYIHVQHHQHVNELGRDPDLFATRGPKWRVMLGWAMTDFFYGAWYLRQLPRRWRSAWRRPAAELAESVVTVPLWILINIFAIRTGNFWTLAIAWLIPQRLSYLLCAYVLIWRPHRGLHETQRQNRYRATRIIVGLEWLGPTWVGSNYHLMHHLHPWLPFYRIRPAWLRNEEAYLEHGAAISTVLGRELSPDEYRKWKNPGQIQSEAAAV